MRRIAFVLISAAATVVMTATAALADSPHFISATNSIDTSTGALVTSFKDAGLGTGTTSIAITLSATANATYQCYNKAGNKPQGVPKSFGPTAIATPPTPFPVRHGATTGSLSLGPLGPGTFSCPSGQILFLDAVSYSNTVVSDATGNSANSTPDPISATLHIQVLASRNTITAPFSARGHLPLVSLRGTLPETDQKAVLRAIGRLDTGTHGHSGSSHDAGGDLRFGKSRPHRALISKLTVRVRFPSPAPR